MPSLDFLTLYVVIFANSLTVCLVWTAFAYRYRPNPAALSWLVGTALSLLGGVVLAIQGNEGSLIPAIVGNAIIIFAFAQFWIGLRRFHGQPGGQLQALGITLAATLVMVAFHDFDRGRAMVYASGQALVMGLCIHHLVTWRQPGVGSMVATAAFAIAMLGQMLVIGSNAGVLAGTLEYASYYALASYALLCTVFSATVWNLGFAVMVVDRLQDRLARLSETDELTGVANRRALDRALRGLQESNHPAPYSVILVDLDDFKQLNDRHGHAAGDQALIALGAALTATVRQSDLVTRLGGDEFCILLPETTSTGAHDMAERLRARLATSPIAIGSQPITLSGSLGIATSEPGTADSLDIMMAADQDLYRDKARKAARSPAGQLVRMSRC